MACNGSNGDAGRGSRSALDGGNAVGRAEWGSAGILSDRTAGGSGSTRGGTVWVGRVGRTLGTTNGSAPCCATALAFFPGEVCQSAGRSKAVCGGAMNRDVDDGECPEMSVVAPRLCFDPGRELRLVRAAPVRRRNQLNMRSSREALNAKWMGCLWIGRPEQARRFCDCATASDGAGRSRRTRPICQASSSKRHQVFPKVVHTPLSNTNQYGIQLSLQISTVNQTGHDAAS